MSSKIWQKQSDSSDLIRKSSILGDGTPYLIMDCRHITS